MIRKRVIDVPELSDEESVLLLIVSEGGRPIFSQSFLEDQAFEDHLFGGFFTAINSFINEKFPEGLDRATFGENTLHEFCYSFFSLLLIQGAILFCSTKDQIFY